MTETLTLAIPKGSLEEATLGLFAQAGLRMGRVGSSLRLSSPSPRIAPILLRPQEIPNYVADGSIDCGLTGYDWLAEQRCVDRVDVLARFLYSKMQSQRPISWQLAVDAASSIHTVDDLRAMAAERRLRVATEIPHVAEQWLAEHGITAELVFSWGATEAKVPVLADAIVECTETGSSLLANGLRAIATVLESTIHFIARPGLADEPAMATAVWIRELLESVWVARRHMVVRCTLPAGSADPSTTPGLRVVRVVADPPGGTVLEALVAHGDVAEAIRRLRAQGASQLTVTQAELYVD